MMKNSRKYFLDNIKFEKIVPNLSNVFKGANVDTLIYVGKKSLERNNISIYDLNESSEAKINVLNQSNFLNSDNFVFSVNIDSNKSGLISKIQNDTKPLSKYFDITRGVNPYDSYTGQSQEIIKSKAYHSTSKKDNTFVPEIRGKHIDRYY